MVHRIRTFRLPRQAPARTLAILAACAAGAIVAFAFAAAWLGELAGEGNREHEGGPAPFIGFLLPLVMLGLFAAGAWLIARQSRRQPNRTAATPLETEQGILALAKQTGGPLTIPEVALHCRLSLVDSRVALRRLTEAGFAQPHVTDHGDLVYVITGLHRPPDDTISSPPAI